MTNPSYRESNGQSTPFRVSLRVVTATSQSLREEMELDAVGAASAGAFRGDRTAAISRFRDRRTLIKAAKGHRRCYYTGRKFVHNIVAAESLNGAAFLDLHGAITEEFDAALTTVERSRPDFCSVEMNRHELSDAEIEQLPVLRAALEARSSLPTTEVVIASDEREAIVAAWEGVMDPPPAA